MLVSTTCYLLHLWHTRLHSSTTGRGSEPKRLLFAPPAVSFFSSSLGVKAHTQESRTEKSHLEPTTAKKSSLNMNSVDQQRDQPVQLPVILVKYDNMPDLARLLLQ